MLLLLFCKVHNAQSPERTQNELHTPYSPSREGYTFVGWSKEQYRIQKASKITARYREGKHKTHYVTYSGRMKGINWPVPLKDEWVVDGEDGVPPLLEKVENYTFAGWTKYDLYTNIRQNKNLSATYHAGTVNTHRVDYVDYDGTPLCNPQYVKDGEDAVRPYSPSREGYTFVGWSKERYRIQRASEIRAQYREGQHKIYYVTYYGRVNEINGSVPLKDEWVVEGNDGVPPNPKDVEGYTFAGWEKSTLYTSIRSNRSIHAMYYNGKVKTHRVKFIDYDGNALYNPQYVIDGGRPSEPPRPKRKDSTFVGWDNEFYQITEQTIIQANYKSGNLTTYPVYFYGKLTGNSSWVLLKEEQVPVGRDAKPPKLPIVSGSTFWEWGEDYTNIQTSKYLYAQYDNAPGTKQTHTVKFWNGTKLLKTESVETGGNAIPPVPPEKNGYVFAGWDDSYIAIKKDKDINTRYVKRQSDVKKERLEELRRSLLKLNLPKSVEVELMNLADVLIEEEENGQNARSLTLSFAVLIYIGTLVSASAWAIFTADEEIRISWQEIEYAFQSCFVNPALIVTIFAKAKADTEEKVAELESGEGGGETDAIALGLSGIAGQYGMFKCKEAADAMADYLKKKKHEFKFITMYYPSKGTIISLTREAIYGFDSKESRISENGYHYGIEYKGIVYCNVHPFGLVRSAWEADFWGDLQAERTITPP